MAVITERIRGNIVRYGIVEVKAERSAKRPLIRPVMAVSVGLILLGLGLVVLMILNWVPVTLVTAFIGFALALVGGIMTLIFCGEI